MIFTIVFKSPGGRLCKLNCIAPSFDECLKKISSLYGKNLIRISYDLRKNLEATEKMPYPEKKSATSKYFI